ncbi:hypothetical protein Tco_0286061, partial [Tanacetum coccineum]
AMAALDSPTDTYVISYLLSPDHMEPEPSKRPSSLDSHETAVARWRARVAARPPSSDPSLLPSSTSIPSTKIAAVSINPDLSTEFTATPHVLLNTPVHATSTLFISATPSQTLLVGPSRKRHRSPVTLVTTTAYTPIALAPARADLLSIRKRFRDLVFYYEASVEDGMEADGEIDGEADVRIDVEDEAYTGDCDTYIRTDIMADAEAHAQIFHPEPVSLVVFPVSTIVVRPVKHGKAIQGMREHLLEMPTHRLEEIKEELRVQRERAEIAKAERNTLRATVRSLGAIKTRLCGTMRDEREAHARIKRHLGLVQEELRQSRMPHR